MINCQTEHVGFIIYHFKHKVVLFTIKDLKNTSNHVSALQGTDVMDLINLQGTDVMDLINLQETDVMDLINLQGTDVIDLINLQGTDVMDLINLQLKRGACPIHSGTFI